MRPSIFALIISFAAAFTAFLGMFFSITGDRSLMLPLMAIYLQLAAIWAEVRTP
jgi:hypothetical protein